MPVAGDADDRDILTRRRRVAVAVLVCSIAVSACSSSGPAPVTPPTEATAPAAPVSSQVNSPPVTPSPTLALATPSPLASGTITTYAGSDSGLGDGGRASAARLDAPEGVALDSAGSLYIADSTNNSIRKVSPGGTISTYAGSGPPPPCCSGGGFSGDGGPATAAQLNAPVGVALDPAGNLYIADRDNQRIRRITSGGTISTYAGTGTPPSSFWGAIVVGGFSGDGGPATAAQLNAPVGVALDPAGNLYIADRDNQRIRRVTPGGTTSTYAGSGSLGFSGDGGPATAARLNMSLGGVALDSAGNLYIADLLNERIRKVSPVGTISTYAGNGGYGFWGDGGPATAAQLSLPHGVALDSAGNLYIADSNNHRIRKVTPGGTISTYAGTGTEGFSGDGGPATAAHLDRPDGVALDSAGNLYIADLGNSRIRKVTPGGTISTYAGNGGYGFWGDGGPATAAQLRPRGMALDPAGNLYIADFGNSRVRKVTPGGTISTYAGTGTPGFAGDGGPATAAQLSFPQGVALDSAGNLYIADSGNSRIRKVTPGGTISTYAGTGLQGFSGDGGPAIDAQLWFPVGVALDSAGNLYIADQENQRIRKVTP